MVEKKIALVSGANKGLGLETSRQLARQGIFVLMGSRDRERGRSAAEALRGEGLDIDTVPLDVTNPEDIEACAAVVSDRWGRLDILVNNAGTVHAEEALFGNDTETVSARALRETFDVNFFGLVLLTQKLLPLLKNSPAGRIVNVASILGSLGIHSTSPDFDGTKPFAYDVSKTAVNAFTVHLAAALKGTAVKVNSAHPGWVRTDLGGPEAPLGVEEGAKTAVKLATLPADGPTGGFFHNDDRLPW